MRIGLIPGLVLGLVCCLFATTSANEIRVATFDVDASPPIGSPLAYDPTLEIEMPLQCRGIVLLGSDKPIVLCAVDWIGIANESNLWFRKVLANAVGTTVDRVAVHTLHQHDAPRSDLSSERLLIHHNVKDPPFDAVLLRSVARTAANKAAESIRDAALVSHIGLGEGRVEKVASNRRILGPDGKVKYTRYTACKDAKIRAEPIGTVDPNLKMISFWDGERCLVAMTYFATHPQSYYRTGKANPDFPGIARTAREKETGTLHVHFNGAGGNIGAGKWNDGSHENRQILADRVAGGMKRAWKTTLRYPISATDCNWKSLAVALPPSPHLDKEKLNAILNDPSAARNDKLGAATKLIWLERCLNGDKINIGCLRLGSARVLFMPGELFVEYQLAAQKMKPNAFVAMAAYGEYGPGYIGTAVSYGQGGYESSPRASNVALEVESVLTKAMKQLLDD